MKRSKVVSLIADELYELNLDPNDAVYCADKLLTKLEKLRMLPPEYLFNAKSANMMNGEWVNEWEPEDEKDSI